MPFNKKWEHYWFYYKWHTIIAAVAVILISFTIYSTVTKTRYDFHIDMLSRDMSMGIAESMADDLEKSGIIGDINGDGSVKVNASLTPLSEQGGNSDIMQMQAIQTRMLVGESTIMFVSKDFIEGYGEQGIFMDITDIADECGIPADTRFLDKDGKTIAIRLLDNKFMLEHGTKAEDSYVVMKNLTHDQKKHEEKIKQHEISPDVLRYILK